jgi:hypothetical protein
VRAALLFLLLAVAAQAASPGQAVIKFNGSTSQALFGDGTWKNLTVTANTSSGSLIVEQEYPGAVIANTATEGNLAVATLPPGSFGTTRWVQIRLACSYQSGATVDGETGTVRVYENGTLAATERLTITAPTSDESYVLIVLDGAASGSDTSQVWRSVIDVQGRVDQVKDQIVTGMTDSVTNNVSITWQWSNASPTNTVTSRSLTACVYGGAEWTGTSGTVTPTDQLVTLQGVGDAFVNGVRTPQVGTTFTVSATASTTSVTLQGADDVYVNGVQTPQVGTTFTVSSSSNATVTTFVGYEYNPVVNGAFQSRDRNKSGIANPFQSVAFPVDGWSAYTGTDNTSCTFSTDRFIGYTAPVMPTGIATYLAWKREENNTGTGTVYFSHLLDTEDVILFAGKEVTVSFWGAAMNGFSPTDKTVSMRIVVGTDIKEGTASLVADSWTNQTSVVTMTAPLPDDGAWELFSETFTIPASIGSDSVREVAIQLFWTPTGTASSADMWNLTGVRMNLGSSVAPYTWDPARELARNRSRAIAPGGSYFYAANGMATSTTAAKFFIPIDPPMRSVPTLVSSGTLKVMKADGTLQAVTGVSVDTFYTNYHSLVLDVTVASGLTAGDGAFLVSDSGALFVVSGEW